MYSGDQDYGRLMLRKKVEASKTDTESQKDYYETDDFFSSTFKAEEITNNRSDLREATRYAQSQLDPVTCSFT